MRGGDVHPGVLDVLQKKKMWSFVEGVTKEEAMRTKYWMYQMRRENHRVSNGVDARVDDGRALWRARDPVIDATLSVSSKQLAARQHSSAALMALHIFACTLSLEMLAKANVNAKLISCGCVRCHLQPSYWYPAK